MGDTFYTQCGVAEYQGAVASFGFILLMLIGSRVTVSVTLCSFECSVTDKMIRLIPLGVLWGTLVVNGGPVWVLGGKYTYHNQILPITTRYILSQPRTASYHNKPPPITTSALLFPCFCMLPIVLSPGGMTPITTIN